MAEALMNQKTMSMNHVQGSSTKEIPLGSGNNKLLLQPPPESKADGLPIKSLLISIDFASTDTLANSEAVPPKEHERVEKDIPLFEAVEEVNLPVLDEKKYNTSCCNMNLSENQRSGRLDCSFFDIDSQIASEGELICGDSKVEKRSSNMDLVNSNHQVNAAQSKSQCTGTSDFQEELEKWGKENFSLSFAGNMQDKIATTDLVPSDWLYEHKYDKTDKQTDTSDLFESYRETISPKLPKWMNKATSFKNVYTQVKRKKSSLPNSDCNLVNSSEKDFNRYKCNSFENHTSSKNGEKEFTHRSFDNLGNEEYATPNPGSSSQVGFTNSEKEHEQQNTSDLSLYKDFEDCLEAPNYAENPLNKPHRRLASTDNARQRKEAVVRPFTQNSTDELPAETNEVRQRNRSSSVNRYDESFRVSDDQVHFSKPCSNVERYLVTKPVMFCRSSGQPDENNSIVSVQLCNTCFEQFIKSGQPFQVQESSFDNQACNTNTNFSGITMNNFSPTAYVAPLGSSTRNAKSSVHVSSHPNPTTSEPNTRCRSSSLISSNVGKSAQEDALRSSKRLLQSTSHRKPEMKFLTPTKMQTSLQNGALEMRRISHRKPNGFKEMKEGGHKLSEAFLFKRDSVEMGSEEWNYSNQTADLCSGETGYIPRPDDCIDSDEFKTACEIIKWHLDNPLSERDESLKAAVLLVQEKWFEISGSKRSKSEVVRNFLNYFQKISPRLLTFVINSVCPDGNTVLHFAVVNSQFAVIKEVLRIKSCDVDKPNKAGNTPIIISAACNIENEEDAQIIRQLLIQGSVNFRSLSMGQTALMMAVNLNNLNMVHLLLECGANINIQDNDGSTALMYACHGGKMSIALKLMKRPECDFSITDDDGFNAFDIALQRKQVEIAMLIYVRMSADVPSHPSTRRGGTSTDSLFSNFSFSSKIRNLVQKDRRRETIK